MTQRTTLLARRIFWADVTPSVTPKRKKRLSPQRSLSQHIIGAWRRESAIPDNIMILRSFLCAISWDASRASDSCRFIQCISTITLRARLDHEKNAELARSNDPAIHLKYFAPKSPKVPKPPKPPGTMPWGFLLDRTLVGDSLRLPAPA